MGVAALGAVMVGVGLAGCARQRAQQDAEPAGVKTAFIDATQPGIGVRLVPVRDTSPRVASVLGPYETNPVPADPALLYRWRRAGLRIIAIRADELDGVLGSFVSAGAGDERWWTEAPNWAPVAAGPWGDGEMLDTGAGVATVGAGRTRLLGRAWFEPWIGQGEIEPTVRLEFVPQRERPREDRALSGLEAPTAPGGAPDAGPVLAELALAVRARAGDAFVIVGASPGEDWAADVPGVAGAGAIGPAVPGVTSVGESMLVDRGSVEKDEKTVRVRPPMRVLIVVRPNIPTAPAAQESEP